MKKMIMISAIALCIGGVAFGAAVKVDLNPPPKSGGDASGRVILNYAKGADKTEIQVNCSGLIGGQNYWITIDGIGLEPIEAVAKKNGTLAVHVKKEGNQTAGNLITKIYRGIVYNSESLVLAGRP